MSNRRFEMYIYRQIILQMRMGDSDRAIAKTGLSGRKKNKWIRLISNKKGWLNRDLPINLKNVKFFHFFSNLLHFVVLFHRISASKKY